MESKQLFIQLAGEIISGKNPNRRPLSADEMRVTNYIDAIRALNKQESKLNETAFFQALYTLYENTQIPLLTVSTSTLLFKKFNWNQNIFQDLTFTTEALKNNKITQNQNFWARFIEALILGNPRQRKFDETRVRVFIKYVQLFFDTNNFNHFEHSYKYFLSHQVENINKAIQYHDLGINTLAFKLDELDFKQHNKLFKSLRFLKKVKASPKIIEYTFIILAKKELTPFAYEDEFQDFFKFITDTFPSSFLSQFDRDDYSKLYQIFEINKTWLVNFDFENLINSNSIKNFNSLRNVIIDEVLRKYGISHFFIKNYNRGNLNEHEFYWFKDVIKGNNLVYSQNLPLTLSKKLVHYFNTVDNEWAIGSAQGDVIYQQEWQTSIEYLSVTEGMIWCSIVNETNNVNYANEIVSNIRGSEHAGFWVKVMIQLHRNGLRENSPINEIMDYIQYQVFTANRQINFKTKKAQNIIEESNEWHEVFGNSKYGMPQRIIKLPKSSIEKFYIEEDDCSFVIRQLKTNKDLFMEGNALHHCVGSYTNNCLIKGSFIFSLRQIDDYNTEKRLITIEVYDNKIFQKRGKYNRTCLPFEDKIIAKWAKENEISH